MATPRAQSGSFLSGLAWGICLPLLAVMCCALLGLPLPGAGLAGALLLDGWAALQSNLRGSVLPFIGVLLAFLVLLQRLDALLDELEPELARIVRAEQLLDLCANLFFGVGVIWTAVGMREALMHGLGDPAGAASAGAFDILQRLVDGGILLALSTTIVGGVGGYLMRLVKSLLLGKRLAALYLRESQRPARTQLDALQRIEGLLQRADPNAESQDA